MLESIKLRVAIKAAKDNLGMINEVIKDKEIRSDLKDLVHSIAALCKEIDGENRTNLANDSASDRMFQRKLWLIMECPHCRLKEVFKQGDRYTCNLCGSTFQATGFDYDACGIEWRRKED